MSSEIESRLDDSKSHNFYRSCRDMLWHVRTSGVVLLSVVKIGHATACPYIG